jgi:hypothetical protein
MPVNRGVWFALIAASVVTACASQTIKEQMRSFLGQPVSTVIAKLGYPTEEQSLAGHKVYIWATGRMVEGTSYTCKIRAILDDQGIITTWDFEGNEGGCSRYASLLRQ